MCVSTQRIKETDVSFSKWNGGRVSTMRGGTPTRRKQKKKRIHIIVLTAAYVEHNVGSKNARGEKRKTESEKKKTVLGYIMPLRGTKKKEKCSSFQKRRNESKHRRRVMRNITTTPSQCSVSSPHPTIGGPPQMARTAHQKTRSRRGPRKNTTESHACSLQHENAELVKVDFVRAVRVASEAQIDLQW